MLTTKKTRTKRVDPNTHITGADPNTHITGADPGFLERGVHMYKYVGVFVLLILSHFS